MALGLADKSILIQGLPCGGLAARLYGLDWSHFYPECRSCDNTLLLINVPEGIALEASLLCCWVSGLGSETPHWPARCAVCSLLVLLILQTTAFQLCPPGSPGSPCLWEQRGEIFELLLK